MSQIYGILQSNGGAPDQAALQAMITSARKSCPDGDGLWQDAGIVLGVGLLRTLPAYRSVTAPVCCKEQGLVVVADARIDNRRDLAPLLDCREGGISDAEIILRAYGKWGEACVEQLTGDFAFAVWDEQKRTLFCARDRFGVKPFYYTQAGDTLVFASTIAALLQSGLVSKDLNETFIADFLAGLTSNDDSTMYARILSLSAAHCMTARDGRASFRRYWEPALTRQISYARDEEYVAHYRELLAEAVRCRLETDGDVAGLLSGGLDSGSITAFAANILADQGRRYTTWSFVLADDQKNHERDERSLIELMHSRTGVAGQFLTTRDFSGRIDDLYNGSDDYLYLGNAPHTAALFRRLADTNTRVLLDGYGGDQCPTSGKDIPLLEFLDGLHFIRLGRYLSASARFHGHSRTRKLWGMLRNYYRAGVPMDVDQLVLERSILAREFRERIDICRRARQNWLFRGTRHRSLREILVYWLQETKGLLYQPLFAENRVERRYPFFDRRLVEYSLAVPSEQHNFGMNRRLIRRSMEGMLPERIRLRHDKSVNNAPGVLSFLYENRDYFIAMIDAARHDEIAAYIDIGKLRRRFAEALSTQFGATSKIDFMPGPTMRTFNMLMFLQRRHAERQG